MKRFAFTGAVILSSLLSFNAMAAQPSPAEQAAAATENRQAVFKLLSVANGPLGGMARGAPFDAAAAKQAAERIKMLAGMIPELFAMDTTSYDVDTRAADTIWSSKADFDQLAQDLVTGADAFLASATAENLRQAFGQNIGSKCGACHDRFRLD